METAECSNASSAFSAASITTTATIPNEFPTCTTDPMSSTSPYHPTSSSLTRTLRLITALSYLWSFPFIIAYAVCANALPLIGLIPLSISLALAIAYSKRETRIKPGAASYRYLDAIALSISHTPQWNFFDILSTLVELCLPGMYLVCLVFTWITIRSSWRGGRTMAMIGTYGTVGLIGNMFIHSYLLTRSVRWSALGLGATCPECRAKQMRVTAKAPMGQRSAGLYQPSEQAGLSAVDIKNEAQGSRDEQLDDTQSEVDQNESTPLL